MANQAARSAPGSAEQLPAQCLPRDDVSHPRRKRRHMVRAAAPQPHIQMAIAIIVIIQDQIRPTGGNALHILRRKGDERRISRAHLLCRYPAVDPDHFGIRVCVIAHKGPQPNADLQPGRAEKGRLLPQQAESLLLPRCVQPIGIQRQQHPLRTGLLQLLQQCLPLRLLRTGKGAAHHGYCYGIHQAHLLIHS